MKFKLLLAATTALAVLPNAYDPGSNGWKTDADGNLVLKDGNPIYVDTTGAEKTVEPGTIGRLNAEAKTNRESVEKLTTKLKIYDGLDPDIARKAIDTVSKLDSKTLIDAGEVDKVREQVKSQFVEQIAARDAEIAKTMAKVNDMTLRSAFAQSEFIKTHVATPMSMFAGEFGRNFKVEDGKTIPLDASGQPLLSKKRAGETATLDEALEIYVDNHPEKLSILRDTPKTGSGNQGNGGNQGGGANTMPRSTFSSLQGNEKMAASQKLAKGELTLT